MPELTKRIALVGLSGAGKSTVAPLLAERLGFDWIDLDAAVERAAGESIATILTARGEPAFRELESSALETALSDELSSRGLVIACGGGILGPARNRERLRESAVTVWLQVSPEAALARLGPAERAKRPLLGTTPIISLRALLEVRSALYASAAQHVVDTENRSAGDVARSIHALWTG